LSYSKPYYNRKLVFVPLEEELACLSPVKGTLLTIGVFDGVHLGHQHLLAELVNKARLEGLISGVVTFKQHPQSLFEPGSNLQFLTSLPQKIRLLKDEGVELIVTLNFTPELAQIGIHQFIGLLKSHLRMRGLVVGPDFAMGRNREGNTDTLCALERSMDFGLTVVPPIARNNELISSTAIRNALAQGDIEKVHDMLGRYFRLEGRVIAGSGRGVDLGFPTANLDIDPVQALAADGVYATLAYIDGQPRQSVTYIGKRPTFGETERTVEVHIMDFDGELYRRNLKIDIIERLRGEHKFNSADELSKQITEDVIKARAVLNRFGRK
jgi:riboflavin kinase/FMN adenylyltransferase